MKLDDDLKVALTLHQARNPPRIENETTLRRLISGTVDECETAVNWFDVDNHLKFQGVWMKQLQANFAPL
jgi:hypothetical protein